MKRVSPEFLAGGPGYCDPADPLKPRSIIPELTRAAATSDGDSVGPDASAGAKLTTTPAPRRDSPQPPPSRDLGCDLGAPIATEGIRTDGQGNPDPDGRYITFGAIEPRIISVSGAPPAEMMRETDADAVPHHHYAGGRSVRFWDRVAALPEPSRAELYSCGVLLQDMEAKVLDWLERAERDRDAKGPPGGA